MSASGAGATAVWLRARAAMISQAFFTLTASDSNPAELLDRFLDGAELLDEGKHPVLRIVEFLGFLEHVGRLCFRNDGDAVFVRRDDIAGIHAYPGTRDRYVDPDDAVANAGVVGTSRTIT